MNLTIANLAISSSVFFSLAMFLFLQAVANLRERTAPRLDLVNPKDGETTAAALKSMQETIQYESIQCKKKPYI